MKKIILVVLFSILLLPVSGQAQPPCNPCNMCDLHGERGDLLDAVSQTFVDAVSPSVAEPKQILTIHGENFDELPPIGTKVNLHGMVNRNGACPSGDVSLQPVYERDLNGNILPFRPDVIRVELPRDWRHSSGGRVNYSNVYTISSIDITYETPGACPNGIRNWTEIFGGVIFGFQGPHPTGYCVANPTAYVIAPDLLRGNVVNNSEIELTWEYDGLYALDIHGFNVYMHWCQAPYEDCNAINPADYALGETKPDMNGDPRIFWEALRDQNGNPLVTDKFDRETTIRANPNGTPTDWANSRLFIAISAFRGNVESEPEYLSLSLP